ncbi:PREDICTED: HAUS augmin-like complex subunit 4 [Mandrillus leucophaeus]|nr:PREDICTED: HAUS augmin-like complex subunit 4 [Mandrillus leucophaeus]
MSANRESVVGIREEADPEEAAYGAPHGLGWGGSASEPGPVRVPQPERPGALATQGAHPLRGGACRSRLECGPASTSFDAASGALSAPSLSPAFQLGLSGPHFPQPLRRARTRGSGAPRVGGRGFGEEELGESHSGGRRVIALGNLWPPRQKGMCSKQLPPCNLSKEDLLQNPYFSKLLLNLSQHVDESGLSLTLAKEQAQAWKEVRLHKTTWLRSEILHRVIQELLVDYYVKMQDTNVTSEDKKFHETLEQRLLVTELMRLLGPSQEREIPPLLGMEKADLLELMPLSEDFVWMRARLQQEVEEQLKKKCFTLLCYYDPNSDADSETVKAAKVWKLAEVLVGEQQQCQDAKSQQKEQMLLLEKKSATYSQVLLRCLTLLQRLLQEHRLKTQSELDRINAQYLEVKCSAMILKLRMEELKILSDTYTVEKVEVHRLIRDRLEGAIHLQEQDMEKSRQVLNSYEVLGEEFDRLVKEYTVLKQATENKRWALLEFNKAYR